MVQTFALLRLAPAGGPGVASCWQRGGARGRAGRPAPGAAARFFPLAERWESCVAAGPFRLCGVTQSPVCCRSHCFRHRALAGSWQLPMIGMEV